MASSDHHDDDHHDEHPPDHSNEIGHNGEQDVWEDEYDAENKSQGGITYNNTSAQIRSSLEIDEPDDQLASSSSYVRRILVISHLFGRSAEVFFQFVLVIFLSKSILSDSLLLVSSYGLFVGLVVFFLGGRAGRFLDDEAINNRRLHSIRVVLLGQYGCVVACSIVCYILLHMHDSGGDSASSEVESTVDKADDGRWMPSFLHSAFEGYSLNLTTTLLLVAIHLLGAFAELFSQSSTVAIEKDWVIVLCGNDTNTNSLLRDMNVALRQIDLGCKMIGPVIAGFYLMFVDEQLRPAIVAVGIMNMISYVVEYCCLTRICRAVPALMVRSNSTEKDSCSEEGEDELTDSTTNATNANQRRCTNCSLLEGLCTYFDQDIFPGGLALALLYLNVLSVGELMTSYLIWRGLSLHLLGIWRGVASIIGLLGTAAYGCSASRRSLKTISVVSIAFFLACLTISFCSMFVSSDAVALAMLLVGVCASRIGLWSFDMSISQLMQETVPETCRGIVGGTQHSLQSLFFALHFVLGILWSNPAQFYVLVAVGYTAVCLAFLLVLCGVYFSRRLQQQ